MKKFANRIRPAFVVTAVFAGCALATPFAHAVEVTARNLKVHLLDEVQKQSETAMTGMVERLTTGDDARLLCLRFEIVATNWAEGEGSYRFSDNDYVLRVGEETIEASARFLSPGQFITSSPGVYFNKPFRDEEQTVVLRKSAVFVVPKDFSQGTFELGDTIKIEVSADDAVPVEPLAGLADFRVTDVQYVDSIDRERNLGGKTLSSSFAPAHGKLALISVEITGKQANDDKGDFVAVTRDLSLEFAGAFTPPAGQMLGKHFTPVTASSVKLGEKKTLVYVFVVSQKLRKANLLYLGEKVADVTLAE